MELRYLHVSYIFKFQCKSNRSFTIISFTNYTFIIFVFIYNVQVAKFLVLRSNFGEKKVLIVLKYEFILSNLLVIFLPPNLHTLL